MRNTLLEKINTFSVRSQIWLSSKEELFLLIFGLIVFVRVLAKTQPAYAYDDSDFGNVCSQALGLIEGKLGSLLAACAGIGAVCAAALGGFRMAWALVVVSVGSFILGDFYTVFFDPCN